MGKKSRKKKTGKTAVPSVVVPAVPVDAAAAGRGRGRGGDSALITLPLSCFHGSNLADLKNVEYIEAVQSYTLICSDICKFGQSADICKFGQGGSLIYFQRLEKFNDDHKHLMMLDADFCRFVFAYCTIFYQKYYHLSANYKMDLTILLSLGIKMRYSHQVEKTIDNVGPGSENKEKSDKYMRDIRSERGIIKCLARETPCDCMDPKKEEAKGMDKINPCNGCNKRFPKTNLFFCKGCQIVKYCSKACQINEWPNHRDLCKNQQLLIEMKKRIKSSMQNNQR